MGFKQLERGVSFNSGVSCNLKDLYDNLVTTENLNKERRKPSQSFAPSSFRCDRLSFFKLRGVDPDPVDSVNNGLAFSAMVGTACHENTQRILKESLKDGWVDVSTFLKSHDTRYPCQISKCGEYETRIKIADPPVNFACDGILNIDGDFYLLEIKTSEYQSFTKLKGPKDQHLDQIKCYCTLLNLDKALVLYIDRMYGDTKCFEVFVKEYEKDSICNRMERVLDYVKLNLAPPKLKSDDGWCQYCKYKQRCKSWG